jgi:hypothetical protein
MPIMTVPLRRSFAVGVLLTLTALSVQAQGSPAPAPSLPPVPTPTALYPGSGIASSYSSPSGVSLYSWQSLYLPIYSHLYHGDINTRTGKPSETLVSAHVSIRNTDPRASLQVTSARYYNTEGKLLREFLPRPQSVAPLGTYELFIPRADASGGSGANFIIEWAAERPINAPLVEALHADIREARTLLFITTAQPIHLR